jgi:hypothetical protein
MNDAAENMARSFFESRRLTTRIWNDGTDVWVDLVNATTGSVVAPQYGRGTNEEDALSSAVARYRVEKADWDQSGVQIAIEFRPTITTPPSLRQIVATACTGEGLQVDDYVRPSEQLAAEYEHPDWNWASPSLTVHIVSGLAVDEIVRKVAVPIGLALASVRRKVSDLPASVVIEVIDRRISLSLKHDDSADEVAKAMSSLPVELEARATIGWDRERGVWFDL